MPKTKQKQPLSNGTKIPRLRSFSYENGTIVAYLGTGRKLKIGREAQENEYFYHVKYYGIKFPMVLGETSFIFK